MNVGDRVWVRTVAADDVVWVPGELVYFNHGECAILLDEPCFIGGRLLARSSGEVRTEKPIPEEVKQLKGVIQSVHEATQGEYADEYFCTKLAEQLYYEGWKK